MDDRIEAIDVLLNEDCRLERFCPLIPCKAALISSLLANQHLTKSACLALTDEALMALGLPDAAAAGLFRRFLCLYDVKESKLREIGRVAADGAEAAAFRELYLLPGVKATRARLYMAAGYDRLEKIASASPDEILRNAASVILRGDLPMKAPLPKEVRTHIAVAKALTHYAV
ncbi:MAG: hypothetical protein IJ343_08425 [Clostridia bacterium]|nr:hypothetical protein [Clostridia bacterium]